MCVFGDRIENSLLTYGNEFRKFLHDFSAIFITGLMQGYVIFELKSCLLKLRLYYRNLSMVTQSVAAAHQR